MNKIYETIIKSLIIGIFILIGSILISKSIQSLKVPEKEQTPISVQVSEKEIQSRYQIVSHGNEIYILDTVTGDCYRKPDATIEGPGNWTKVESPFAEESDQNK